MAQTGFTPIQLYSTSTAAAAPVAGNLTNSTLGSELAINITDGKLFYKDNANAVQVIGWKTVPTTAGGTGLTTYTAGDLSYYATGTTFTKLAIGTTGQILTSTGSAPQWSTLSGVAVTTFSAGTTGFTPNSATSGAITLAGTLAVGNGGTGTSTAFTAGSVVFAGASGVYSQDNANLFWDDANNRLGIGIATPAYPFQVSGGSNQILGFYKNTDATNISYITVRDKDDLYLNLGRVSSSACFIGYADALRFQQGATLHGLFDASGNFAVGTSTTGFNSAGLPLVVGSGTGNTGMTIFSGNASSGSIHFADGTSGSDSFRGFINYNHSTNSMQFGADAAEDMRITSSGNVGIGVTPSTRLDISGGTGGARVQFSLSTASADYFVVTPANDAYLPATWRASTHQWFTSATERMRLFASGGVSIGNTTDPGAGNLALAASKFIRLPSASTNFDLVGNAGGNDYLSINANGTQRHQFNDAGAAYNTTGTWGTISDARLKENINDATAKLDDVLKLRVVNYNLKTDPEIKQIGFIAQDIEQVFPGLVEQGEPTEDGDFYKSVKTSVLIPILVKAMQEQQTQIDELKNQLTQLKGN